MAVHGLAATSARAAERIQPHRPRRCTPLQRRMPMTRSPNSAPMARRRVPVEQGHHLAQTTDRVCIRFPRHPWYDDNAQRGTQYGRQPTSAVGPSGSQRPRPIARTNVLTAISRPRPWTSEASTSDVRVTPIIRRSEAGTPPSAFPTDARSGPAHRPEFMHPGPFPLVSGAAPGPGLRRRTLIRWIQPVMTKAPDPRFRRSGAYLPCGRCRIRTCEGIARRIYRTTIPTR